MIKVFRHYILRISALLAVAEAALFFGLVVLFSSTDLLGHWVGAIRPPLDLSSAAAFAAPIVTVMVLAMGATGLYHQDVMFEMDGVLARAALSFSLAFAAFSCLSVALSYWGAPDPALYKIAAVAIAVCAVTLLGIRSVFGRLAKQEALKRRILVIGCGRSAAKIADMNNVDRYRFRVVGYVDFGGEPNQNALEPSFPDSAIATPEAALALVKLYGIDGIVVASDERRGLPHKALLQCRMAGVTIQDFTTFWECHAGNVDLESLQPSWLTYSDGFAMNRDWLIRKACFDYAIALALLVATAPITILTALLIKATSRGPIFFRQARVGRNGAVFDVLKFRTMAIDAEKAGPQWARANDSRVTGIGRFIRKVRIDEIPQVINILRGDMSFVGPRPERPHFVPQLTAAIPYFDERHRVKPGLSGWAQINYPYGASVEDARNKLSYDLYYLKNGSIFLDFVILLRTVQVILWPHGAR